MAVWLTMNMSHEGSGDSANTAKIFVTVDVHWNAKHYNRDGGTLKVTVDGATSSYTAPFNAKETSSGSERLYSAYWTVDHSSSRTVYGSATFQATDSTAATPASAQVYLSGSGGSGGSGGDSGDDDDGGNTGGGSSGGGSDEDDGGGTSGGGSGGYVEGNYCHYLHFTISEHCKVDVYTSVGTDLFSKETESIIRKYETNYPRQYTFVFMADKGYELCGCSVNGVSCDDIGYGSITAADGDYFIVASAVMSNNQDGGNQGWTNGDSYDANDPPLIGEKSPDGSHYVLVKQADGTKLTVTRTYVDSDSYYAQGDYVGELVDGELFQDDYGKWYKYRAWDHDLFTIEAEALPGYNIDSHSNRNCIFGRTYNFHVTGAKYTAYGKIYGWNYIPEYYGEVVRIYTTATKIGGSGKEYGSGSGTLYFYATQYDAKYAVEFSYSDNTFYVNNVKIQIPDASTRDWYFNLIVKINDVVICEMEKHLNIRDSKWYDLGISGSTGITDEVKITFCGTADSTYPSLNEFSVASPTVQTIIISYSVKGAFVTSGTDFFKYDVYIANGTGWDKAVACVSLNGEWVLLE